MRYRPRLERLSAINTGSWLFTTTDFTHLNHVKNKFKLNLSWAGLMRIYVAGDDLRKII